jgi:hypothetical protein
MANTKICIGTLVFRRYRTDPRTKKRLDARRYGKKAWPMCFGKWVDKEKAVTAVTT